MINRTACVFGARAKRIAAHGLVVIALSFIVSSNLKAQGLAGIQGNVSDEQGAKVAGANVLLHSRSGIQLATITDQAGAFEFRNLGSGAYLIEVKAPGFSVFSSDEISLEHSETRSLDFDEVFARSRVSKLKRPGLVGYSRELDPRT